MWPFLALIFSGIVALIIHLNHLYKIEGLTIVMLRIVPMVLVGGIPLFFLEVPQGSAFYIISIILGIFWMVADMVLFNLAAQHGGRVASLFQPLKILFVFGVWSLLKPETFMLLLNPIWKLYGVIACFLLITGAMITMRKNDMSLKILISVSVVALLLGVDDMAAKLILEEEPLLGGALAFSVVSAASASVSAYVAHTYIFKKSFKSILTPHIIKGSFLSGFLLIIALGVFYAALSLAPNPAYVLAIAILSILWLTLYYHIKHKEKANIISGLIMMLGAIGLILITP